MHSRGCKNDIPRSLFFSASKLVVSSDSPLSLIRCHPPSHRACLISLFPRSFSSLSLRKRHAMLLESNVEDPQEMPFSADQSVFSCRRSLPFTRCVCMAKSTLTRSVHEEVQWLKHADMTSRYDGQVRFTHAKLLPPTFCVGCHLRLSRTRNKCRSKFAPGHF